MIEGLRLLPWLQERIRNDRDTVGHFIDCDKCMQTTEQTTRQAMGCAYESPDPRVPVTPWQHAGYTDAAPTACVGYTTKLPEVIEVTRARLHWKHGAIREFCGGKPSEQLLRCIEILEGAVNEASCWRPEGDK